MSGEEVVKSPEVCFAKVILRHRSRGCACQPEVEQVVVLKLLGDDDQ